MQMPGMQSHMLMMAAIVVGVLILLVIGLVFLVRYFARPVAAEDLAKIVHPPLAEPGRHPASRPDRGKTGAAVERDTFMVIPDISGYTRFIGLNRFSAGHAQYVISQLLHAVIDAAQPPLTATRVEGDAVVFHAMSVRDDPGAGVAGVRVGRAILDLLSAYYRKRAELSRENACPCTACQHIDDLDIKVIVHRGPILHYSLKGFEDLSGVAVIVAHRLLKNSVGMNRYVLATEAASEELGLPLARAGEGHREVLDGVGEVGFDVYDFEPDTLVSEEAAEARRPIAPKTRDLLHKLGENAHTLWQSIGVSKPNPWPDRGNP